MISTHPVTAARFADLPDATEAPLEVRAAQAAGELCADVHATQSSLFAQLAQANGDPRKVLDLQSRTASFAVRMQLLALCSRKLCNALESVTKT